MSEADQWITAEAERNRWSSPRGQQIQTEQHLAEERRNVERMREAARAKEAERKKAQEALTEAALDEALAEEKRQRKLRYFETHPLGSDGGFERLWKEELRPLLAEPATPFGASP